MPRKNPDTFPEDIQRLVVKFGQLSGENVVRKEVVFADEKVTRKIKWMVYAYLSALETWQRQGDDVLRKNRLIAYYFKRNYGLAHVGRTLVFVPKSDPILGAEGLRDLVQDVAQTVAAQPDTGLPPIEPDVGVEKKSEGQVFMEHLRSQPVQELDFGKLLGGEKVATPESVLPQLGLDNSDQKARMSESGNSPVPRGEAAPTERKS